MDKYYLANEVSRATGLTIGKSTEVINSILENVSNAINEDGLMVLRRFGTFKARHKNERLGRNPKNGQDALISARRVATFTPSKLFRRKVNES